jgi:hypothetical protein
MADKSPPPLFRGTSPLSASEQRDKLIREMIEKERAQTDAKTARLRALRMAKEAEDQAAGKQPSPPTKNRRR